MCLIERSQDVYPLDIVRTMRDQRAMMIQTAVSSEAFIYLFFHLFIYLFLKPVQGDPGGGVRFYEPAGTIRSRPDSCIY